MRNIWLHRLIAETGLPSYRVRIPREIVHDMEAVLKEKMPRDQQGCIQFEDFLPILVYLLRWHSSGPSPVSTMLLLQGECEC